MKKRGQSGIITIVLLMLVVLVIVSIVWVVIRGVVTEKSEEIVQSSQNIKLLNSLSVENWKDNNDGTINITVKRDMSEGDIKGLSYTIKTDVTICYIKTNNTLSPLETKTFVINISSCSGEIQEISVSPILTNFEEEKKEPECVYGEWTTQGCGLGPCTYDEIYKNKTIISGTNCQNIQNCSFDLSCIKQTGIGITGIEHFDEIPYFKDNIQTLQVSGFDRNGGNDDGVTGKWSYLYKEGSNYIIFDETGPGIIQNLWMAGVGYLDETNGRILFYFDNETTPRINMNIGDFFNSVTEPFVSPLAGKKSYTRYSLAPILFKERLKIVLTNLVSPAIPNYYHVTYQKYLSSVNVNSYDGTENYANIKNMWNNKGSHPTGDEGTKISNGTKSIESGQTQTLIDYSGNDYNYISSIKIRPPHDKQSLENLWVSIYFDGEAQPSVYAPVGEFFGSGLGEFNVSSIAIGMSFSGDYYCYFPMPFKNSVRIQIENNGSNSSSINYTIKAKKDSEMIAGDNAGYFHAKYNKEFPTQKDKDYIFLNTTGRGHFVGVVHTMRGLGSADPNYLEGDERFFIDGKLSPSLHGTGTEDYYDGALYFFYSGACPYYQAMFGVSCIGILSHTPYRLHIPDFISFTSSATFGIEHGSSNEDPSNLAYSGNYSSVAFYYAVDTPSTELTDSLNIGNNTSESLHEYNTTNGIYIPSTFHQYPGYDTATPVSVSDDGINFTNGQSQFTAAINSNNTGVIIRRRLDYSLINQMADIYVDDNYAGKWYTAGMHDINNTSNNIKWLDSDFHIPASFTHGKSSIRVRIQSSSWNEFYYWIYSKKR
ncbi:MAG: DUF2961 domain-containing protein [Candidatus Nanoarchaeia archaeon]|nr:DUF2961 domain-containing protein [Candidatus Nanoarchaeia archaeon]MDD5740792.1 DUF2961 domain-containing protein [Candidatus Nanoarchaeia archaeon]